MRGVKPEMKHRTDCPAQPLKGAERLDPANCRCSPMLRFFVRGAWRVSDTLPRGWRQREYDRLFAAAVREKDAVDAGDKAAKPPGRTPILREWMRTCIERIEAGIESGVSDAFSPNTLASYRTHEVRLNALPIARKRLTAITTPDLENARTTLLRTPYSEGYVQDIMLTLSGMLNYAVGRQDIPLTINPIHVANRANYGHRSRPRTAAKDKSKSIKFRPDLIKQLLLDHHGTVLGEMIALGATTGMRQREIMGSRELDLDIANGRFDLEQQLIRLQLDTPKYESMRRLPLCTALVQRWTPRDGGSAFLFIDKDTGLPFKEAKATKLFNRAWEAIEPRPKGLSWHVLRHTFDTLLDQAGIRQHVIDKVMGHSRSGDARFTYKHMRDAELDAVREVIEAEYGLALFGVAAPVSAEALR